MSNQTYQKLAILAMSVVLVLTVGVSQYTFAQFCSERCYSSPEQKKPSIQVVLGQDGFPDDTAIIGGI